MTGAPKPSGSVGFKLTASKKKPPPNVARAEAEEKRRREDAENAAALAEFRRDMGLSDEEEEAPALKAQGRGSGQQDNIPSSRPGGSGTQPRRHFTNKMMKSGPGTLDLDAPSFDSQRFRPAYTPPNHDRGRGTMSYNNVYSDRRKDVDREFGEEEDTHMRDVDSGRASHVEKEDEAVYPTVRLSGLPPDVSDDYVKDLLPDTLKVRRLVHAPPAGPGSSGRKSVTRIAVVEASTEAINAAVTKLKNKYLYRGHWLDISQYTNSKAMDSALKTDSQQPRDQPLPFGAKPIIPDPKDRFAPPTASRTGPTAYVQVQIPKDLNQLRLIHRTIQQVLEKGAEWEAALMLAPEVINDEKWAFLWDSSSPDGVYYRWRLWFDWYGPLKHGVAPNDPLLLQPQELFEGTSIQWIPPRNDIPFLFAKDLGAIVNDPDCDISEDDFSDDEGVRKFNRQKAPPEEDEELGFLGALDRAQLLWYLSELPTSHAKAKKEDVARVTFFALSHANKGIDEIVDLIVTNIERPFAFVKGELFPEPQLIEDEDANKIDSSPEKQYSPPVDFNGHSVKPEGQEGNKQGKDEDPSDAKILALHCISDIIAASMNATELVGTWQYRQKFQTALKQREIFSKLGRLDRDLQWGLMKTDKWQRAVKNLLASWRKYVGFDAATQDYFEHNFANPPLTAAEQEAEDKKAKKAKSAEVTSNDRPAAKEDSWAALNSRAAKAQYDGAGDVVDEHEEADANGDAGFERQPTQIDEKPKVEVMEIPGETAAARARRLRPKAEDMFADSDGE